MKGLINLAIKLSFFFISCLSFPFSCKINQLFFNLKAVSDYYRPIKINKINLTIIKEEKRMFILIICIYFTF